MHDDKHITNPNGRILSLYGQFDNHLWIPRMMMVMMMMMMMVMMMVMMIVLVKVDHHYFDDTTSTTGTKYRLECLQKMLVTGTRSS